MKNKKIFLTGILVFIITIIIVFITYSIKAKQAESMTNEYKIYYLNKNENTLEPESVILNMKNEQYETVLTLIKQMKVLSKSTNLIPVINSNIEVLNINFFKNNEGKDVLNINFSKEYLELKEVQEIFLRAALVKTLTQLDFVKNIQILIEGEPLKKSDGEEFGLLNEENVVLNPIIAPDKIETKQVVLYFSDDMLLGLEPEIRTIEVKQSQSLENQILEELILGPKQKSLYATIPSETKIRNVKTEENICYVDLSSEFVSKHSGGSSAETFTIYSIVNSLTELENVKKVQFLIEGEKVNIFKGHLDISQTFERDESLILK